MDALTLTSSALLWVVSLLNILLTLGLARRISRRFPETGLLKPGQAVPDFRAWTLEGETVTRAAYVGKRTAFVFFSPRCSPCRDELPRLEGWRSQSEACGIGLVLVSDSDEVESRRFIDEVSSTLPTLIAPRERSSFLTDYKVVATPCFYLVKDDGKVQAAGLGLYELQIELKRLSEEAERR